MPASLACWTAATVTSAPALSRMIAAALREIAVSNAWLCLVGSSSWLITRVSYPSYSALAFAASCSALKNSCPATA